MFSSPASKVGRRRLSPGVWLNNRLAIAGAYTARGTDVGYTLALGGNALYSLTFGSPANYSPTAQFVVVNEDAGRAKNIVVSGGLNFLLWPGQIAFVFASNGVWQVHRDKRWKLTANTTINVDLVSGSAANDGLASGTGALATWQQAVDIVAGQWDLSGFGVTIQGTAGQTSTAGILIRSFVGGGSVTIDGGGGGGAIATTAAGVAAIASSGQWATSQPIGISNITISASNYYGVLAQDAITFEIASGCTFSSCLNGILAAVAPGAQIQWTADFAVFGNSAALFLASLAGCVAYDGNSHTITVNTPNWTSACAVASYCGQVYGPSLTFSGSATGKRYDAHVNGVISPGAGGANYYPGTVAGTTGNGGVYA